MSLLSEEMQRILEFLDWRAKWWTSRAKQKLSKDAAGDEGFCAYAHRQAGIHMGLLAHFQGLWANVAFPSSESNLKISERVT